MLDATILDSVGLPRLGKLAAAVVIGFGVGSLLSPDPVTLPVVGTLSGTVFGAAGLLVGGSLYVAVRRSTSGCGCEGDCNC